MAEDRPRKRSALLGWLFVVLSALAVNLFLFTTVGISGSSMEPSLSNGERALVPRYEVWLNRLGGRGWQRGDIVFFPDPRADCNLRCPWVIKRIVGLPGETVSIRQGTVLIDGTELAEPYLDGVWKGSFTMGELTVPDGTFFVLGDNRYPYGSHDSRSYGPVPAGSIAGRVTAVVWPVLRTDGELRLNWRGRL